MISLLVIVKKKKRLSSHQLCIETGRHSKPKLAVVRRLCDFNEMQSEAHFMMHCSLYLKDRLKLFTNVLMEDFSVIIDDRQKTYVQIFSFDNDQICFSLSKFVHKAF